MWLSEKNIRAFGTLDYPKEGGGGGCGTILYGAQGPHWAFLNSRAGIAPQMTNA